MHRAVELSELRLTEDRPAHVFEHLVDEKRAFLLIFGLVQHEPLENDFTGRRCYFGGEHRITRVNWRLAVLREIALAGVAEFVRDGRDVAETSLVIQKDIRGG